MASAQWDFTFCKFVVVSTVFLSFFCFLVFFSQTGPTSEKQRAVGFFVFKSKTFTCTPHTKWCYRLTRLVTMLLASFPLHTIQEAGQFMQSWNVTQPLILLKPRHRRALHDRRKSPRISQHNFFPWWSLICRPGQIQTLCNTETGSVLILFIGGLK